MPQIDAAVLRRFAHDLLCAGGFTNADATQTAELLVWANLRGVDSHGVLRIPRYLEMIETGVMLSGGSIETVSERGAVCLLDGGKCPGAVGMNAAVAKAADLARVQGLGWCAVRRISHAGAVGYFTSALARQGLVGLAMTASKPLMNYHGAVGEALSTNPLAIAVPVPGAEPVVLDMSTAAVALGKIMAAKENGRAIPRGWGVDAEGRETTDPAAVTSLLPMAGAKGSGLSLMIELLTSVLAGNPVIGPVLEGTKKGGFNGMVLAIDPAAFGATEVFLASVRLLVDQIHALPPAPGTDAVLLPGERGAQTAARRRAEGIPLAAGTAANLAALAGRLGVAVPYDL
ncbi:Ldh family oxidoreductase [Pararhodobacter aggregans]|uniref:Dehydrogenase n=1 Tax=Pararhodobacter aggregans TaxID=404875 RepID=A0A2T7UX69_9RHOB|nr:Ldh family oxidoreductase [Pararhodobacter aggregans]PTX04818.1 LDH2 family malate/lactate/ureidoglycolate dehydrogenase [Pararhodobacter aggregans]PVE49148.1 dehydrogenase [Pararhodobacter aggregans]